MTFSIELVMLDRLVRRRFHCLETDPRLRRFETGFLWGLVAGPCNQVALKKMKGC